MNLPFPSVCLLTLIAVACGSASAPATSPTNDANGALSAESSPCAAHQADSSAHRHEGKPGHAGEHMAMHEGMAMWCPMEVPGTTVASTELSGAAALEFTTTGDVAELRRRVTEMAEHHRRRHEHPPGGDSTASAPAPSAPMGGSPHGHHRMVPAEVRVEEIPNGARLVFTPLQAGDLGRLREHLEMRSKQMASSGCQMMSAPEEEAPGTAAPNPSGN